MDGSFLESSTDDVHDIRALIEQCNAKRVTALEQELFKQRKRLADAERVLQTKTTKAAIESRRIAADKIDTTLRRLEDITRIELEPRDLRIFPGYYAPVRIVENGERVVKPMRYQRRIAGAPASFDVK
jgi:hypothetical protein